MPLNTNLLASPYFDDFDRNKDYYRILFKPATAVQVREVNQLQSMLQDQVEQFGDHVLKAGTILSGCDFTFKNAFPYVKILDTTQSGAAVDLADINGLFVKENATGKIAKVVHVENGFENDAAGNLKTLYLDYNDDADVTQVVDEFTQGNILRVFAKDNRLFDLTVSSGGTIQAFSNSDVVVILPAIEVVTVTDSDNNWPNPFVQGETLTNSSGSVEVLLTSDSDFYTNTENETSILRIKPNPAKQSGSNLDVDSWEKLAVGTVLTTSSSNNELKVVGFRGTGATGTVTTTTAGQIADLTLTRGGVGYDVLPHVSVYSLGATPTQIQNLVIAPQGFYQEVTIASSADFTDPVGYGYGVSVSAGKIYQKGLFLNVGSQFKMVEKYSNTPTDVSIGFDSTESVINVFTDSSLYDNAQGFLNSSAPGADRLKLTPVLVVKTDAQELTAANYFPLVRFSEGNPYLQNKLTQYNKLGDMIAERTYEESGNYVLDEFNAATKSTPAFADSNTNFTYVIDPGHAYINGYRVQTETNFTKNVAKGTETETANNQGIDLNYANYVVVNEVAGAHVFTSGQTVQLTMSHSKFITLHGPNSNTVISSMGGSSIGTARVRSMLYESGIQGTADARYRLYLFDIQMSGGYSFDNVRGIYSPDNSGTSQDGIADIVLQNGNQFILRSVKSTAQLDNYRKSVYTKYAELVDSYNDTLVFDVKAPVKSFSNYSYIYRQVQDSLTVATDGTIQINHDGGTTVFPYVGSLSDVEENDLIIVPTSDIVASSQEYTGVSISSAEKVDPSEFGANCYVITVSASTPTASFTSAFEEGDYIQDGTDTAQILRIDGQNKMTIRTNTGAYTNTAATYVFERYFPKDVPIPLNRRSSMSANVNSNKTTMTIDLGLNVDSGSTVTVTYDQKITNAASNLTVNRGCFVKITTTGGALPDPKCLGFSGIFRLKNVYNGANTSAEVITDEFYVDHNQNPSYYGLGYLYTDPRNTSPTTLANTILVEVDYISEATHGLKIINSYTLNDATPLANLTSSMHMLEIPELTSNNGRYHDLRECADFRIMAEATANTVTDPADANITCDPIETVTFPSTSFKFPKPQSDFTYDYTYFKPRRDEISIMADGRFEVSVGATETKRDDNPQKLVLYTCDVAAYPSLPENLSTELKEIINKRTMNLGSSSQRISKYSNTLRKIDSQTRGYTMNEIASLEKRISALEYNQNISTLENATRNRTIQSSVDSTLERFKFGFFVDNFENYNMSAIGDPNFAASIYEYKLQPSKNELAIEFEVSPLSTRYITGNTVRFPSRRRKLSSQSYATYAPVPETPEIEINQFCEFKTNQNKKHAGTAVNGSDVEVYDSVWEEFTFVGFSEAPEDGLTRQIKINFFNPEGGIAYEVIQTSRPPTNNNQETGNSVWLGSQAPTQIPSSEALDLYIKKYPVKNANNRPYQNVNVWLETGSVDSFTFGSTTLAGVSKSGQIKFDYDHTKGKYITVRVYKRKPVFNFEICYYAETQTDAIYDKGSTSVNQTPPCPRGEFLYHRCEGTTRVNIVCDGNRGEMVGNKVENSPDCGGGTVIVDPPDTEPEQQCPAAGTVWDTKCRGFTRYVYTFTGESIDSLGGYGTGGTTSSVRFQQLLRQTGLASNQFIGNCQIEAKTVEENSEECGYVVEEGGGCTEHEGNHCDGGSSDCGTGNGCDWPPVITCPSTGGGDDDGGTPQPEIINISAEDITVKENTTGYVKVRLDKVAPQDININFKTTDGTATEANQDYIPRTGSVRIPKGRVETTIYIRAKQDVVSESNETMFIDLLNADYEHTAFVNTRATVTITDVTTPNVRIEDATTTEKSGTMNFNVILSEASNVTVSVNYATSNGTRTADSALSTRWSNIAVAGQDYTSTSGTLTFAAGETQKIISVPILEDQTFEINEVFNVTLSSPSNCHLAGNGGSKARGVIINTNFIIPPIIGGGGGGGTKNDIVGVLPNDLFMNASNVKMPPVDAIVTTPHVNTNNFTNTIIPGSGVVGGPGISDGVTSTTDLSNLAGLVNTSTLNNNIVGNIGFSAPALNINTIRNAFTNNKRGRGARR